MTPSQLDHESQKVIKSNILKIQRNDYSDTPNLPKVHTPNNLDTTVKYNGERLLDFQSQITDIYEKIKYWKNNMFDIPSGSQPKKLIDLMNFWLDQFNKDTPFASIALKVFMIIPNLILQKSSKTSKAKEHIQLMNTRLQKWDNGDFIDIFRECNIIQNKLLKCKKVTLDFERLFVRFMLLGKVNSAIRLLERNSCGGVLPMNDTNLNLLYEKHPKGSPAYKGSLLNGPILDVPKSFYDKIDNIMIDRAIMRTKVAPGPSKKREMI